MDIFSRLRDLQFQLNKHLEGGHDMNEILEAIELLSTKIDLLTQFVENLNPTVVHSYSDHPSQSEIENDGLISIEDEEAEYIPEVKIGKSKGRVKDNKPVIISSDVKNSLNSMDNIGK